MALTCGIVGLPNVGKSTTFNALTKAGASVANYPFCTIEPNSGVVDVPDERMTKISEKIPPQRQIPATVEFVDIAGLVKGASKGEGLGNQFLGNIRQTQVIVHVVRCFEDDDIIHVDGSVDPLRDIETIDTELLFSDMEFITRRVESLKKQIRSGNKEAAEEESLLSRVATHLETGSPARIMDMTEEERATLQTLNLITAKPVLFCCNVSEDDVVDGNEQVEKVKVHAKTQNAEVVWLCASIEAEIAVLDEEEEKAEFLESLGLTQSGLSVLARKGYDLLGLQTYFTAGEKEVRAWTIGKGFTAPQAAGVIHTDFERGFIRAETYSFDDLMEYESEKAIKEAGKLRVEGKEYVMQDGDIVHFLFNV
jgi:GTP-binding protein YchF